MVPHTAPTVAVENLGPIEQLSFSFRRHGMTVLSAPNGTGKSILLNAMQAAARGTGKLPLRDNQRRGSLDAFGARITLGKSTRHNGEFDVCHLEGRFDLSVLVDPGLKSPRSADAKRILALVSLLEVAAEPDLFRNDAAFDAAEFADVVKPASLEADCPVEMARRIKADYDEHARLSETEAERFIGEARSCEDAAGEMDTDVPHDATALQESYDLARDEHARLQANRVNWMALHKKSELARLQLHVRDDDAVTVEGAWDALRHAEKSQVEADEYVEHLTAKLSLARAEATASTDRVSSAATVLAAVERSAQMVSAWQTQIADVESVLEIPTDAIDAAKGAVEQAAEHMERGTRVRAALERIAQAEGLRFKSQMYADRAGRLRDCGASADDVLSTAINCSYLQVRSVGGETRLVVTNHARQDDVGLVPFGELSEGERWRIAIDLASDRVGEDGLIVIPQEAWEGLDRFARTAIDDHMLERSVYGLTGEATRESNDADADGLTADDVEMKAGPYNTADGAAVIA